MSRIETEREVEERHRREVLQEMGQVCLDWAQDTGSCHVCTYDGVADKPHDDFCPLRKLTETTR